VKDGAADSVGIDEDAEKDEDAEEDAENEEEGDEEEEDAVHIVVGVVGGDRKEPVEVVQQEA